MSIDWHWNWAGDCLCHCPNEDEECYLHVALTLFWKLLSLDLVFEKKIWMVSTQRQLYSSNFLLKFCFPVVFLSLFVDVVGQSDFQFQNCL
jgi:hypothetical protein